MKTKYLFCAAPSVIDERTVFVDVYVGHTKQELRDFNRVSFLSVQHSFYFAKWCNDVQLFLDRVCASLTSSGAGKPFRPFTLSLSISDLRRLLVNGQYYAYISLYRSAFNGCLSRRFSGNSAVICAKNRASELLLQSAHVKNLSRQRVQL